MQNEHRVIGFGRGRNSRIRDNNNDRGWRNEQNEQNVERWREDGHSGRTSNFSRGNARVVRQVGNSDVFRQHRSDSTENISNNRANRNQRVVRPMGFRLLQNLLENEDLEDVIFQITNERKGFSLLLDSKNVSGDIVILVVKLLSKICDSGFHNNMISVLEKALRSQFLDNLVSYVAQIAIQGEREKRSNNFFWKDPDLFWNDILNVSRQSQRLIPQSSCDVILKILKALKVYIPAIEENHSIHISDEIKSNVGSLYDTVEKTCQDVERRRECRDTRGQNDEEEEPPDDFRDINVYPNIIEVTTRVRPYLRPNVIDRPYRNVEHYLDIQYRLLREDFVKPLREDICKYIENPRTKLDNIKVYRQVRFLNMENVNDQRCFRVQFDFSKQKRTFNYENSRRFMFGSLLCFAKDSFSTLLFGKVVGREKQDLEKGHIIAGFDEDMVLHEDLYTSEWLMLESTVYFEPYYHVLNVLKRMRIDNFPMEKYIVLVETDPQPPSYLLGDIPKVLEIENRVFYPLQGGFRRFFGLNDSQQVAFQAALTQEFVVIQGPPGTGKTFLGLKIAHTLLKNKSAWYNDSPMLVICYTNHALDQFLEGLLPVTTEVLRVGGQSKNEKLKNFNIRYKRQTTGLNAAVFQKRQAVRGYIQKISTINENLRTIEKNDTVVGFEIFKDVVPNYRNSFFYEAGKDAVSQWLLAGHDTGERRLMPTAEQQVANNFSKLKINQAQDVGVNEQETEEIWVDDNQIFDDVFDGIVIHGCQPLVSLESLKSKLQLLENEIISVMNSETMDEWSRRHQLPMLDVECARAISEAEYLRTCLNQFGGNFPKVEPAFVDMKNPERMNMETRWQLYFYWIGLYVKMVGVQKERLTKEFRKTYKEYKELEEMQDTQVMKKMLVIGMTTTGAARLQSSLQALKSPIVIVEEAAEVLEAHIISSLTSHCKHLILIGDHQQLKPSTANYTIETKFQLGISLFERMVLNKIQCYTLNVQHRMRPEISSLVHPAVYPDLEDHETTKDRPPIRGIENVLYFIDHREREASCNDNSKKNIHEAKFLIRLARHLILNDYKPENIVILAAYLGQMFEMQRLKSEDKTLLQDVRIAVLDNYQGEESDIILLSLVRNNDEKKIGFLKIENRVCVALSRARNGMYIMGNMEQLCDSSEIWKKIKEVLVGQNAIGPYLTLRCQVHRHKISQVQTANDFHKLPEGGCDLLCGAPVSCGHTCQRLCHVTDRDHHNYICREKCTNALCNDPSHICRKLCYERCGPCTYPVQRDLECSHSVVIDCHVDPAAYNCIIEVKTTLPCGHEADKPCHKDALTFTCPHPCETRVEPCGHACTSNCHIRRDPDHLEYKCLKPCDKYRIGCSLKDTEHGHVCINMCYQDCITCEVGVMKKRSKCSHAYTIACRVDVDDIICGKPCTKKLPCGHNCRNKCFQPCGDCQIKVMKVVPDCNHKVKVKCSEEPTSLDCQGKCPRLLPCGHPCGKKCNQACTTRCKQLVDCLMLGPCGHNITRFPCFLKNSTDPEKLLKYCTEKCDIKLKCNHMCAGSCGDCSQSRIHMRCMEKCGVPLICNHECDIPCREACRPCKRKCEHKCSHSKCSQSCGDPCTPCKEPCRRQCKHQHCSKKCSKICDVPPCHEPCDKVLKCKHPCVGFCGDPCPKLCRICHKDELTEVFFGNEDEEDAVYVMLVDCKHIFESSGLKRWLEEDGNEIKAKVCPKCKTTIKNTQRYSEYVKQSIQDIINVKRKSNGTLDENEIACKTLLEKAMGLQIRSQAIGDCSTTLEKLMERLKPVKKQGNQKRRQHINKMELGAVKSKVQVIEIIVEAFEKEDLARQASSSCYELVSFILNALIREEDSITDQEIEDVNLELDRLMRYLKLEKLRQSAQYEMRVTYREQEALKIEERLKQKKRYDRAQDDIIKLEFEALNKLCANPVAITETERREIVGALGLQAGHWFKCQNGHPYIITECGGAMQVSTCNECGVPIGGINHQLLHGAHAPEMDNARFPAWSEQANMANYGFR